MKKPTERVDERDTMFARAALMPGTPPWQDYYARRPDLQAGDEALRALPRLLEPGSAHFDPVVMGETRRHFEAIEALEVDPTWLVAEVAALRGDQNPATRMQALARSLGAVAAAWTELDPAFVYTHKGRFPEDHGRPVDLPHPRVLVFLVEMDLTDMQAAPLAPTIRESAHQYFRAAQISLHLEAVLRGAGFAAKQHYDAHYDLILPPLAVAAGLGEMGRHNILIADRFGSRVRIGAVSTDLPAVSQGPRSLGAESFCAACRKCAENCPSRALSLGEPEVIRGVRKWPTQVEACYRYWRTVGTDCGVCMACCPFSHANSAFHNLVRWMVRTQPWSHRLLVWMDALIYGRKWRPRRAPRTRG